jgi:hypothetical protein
MEKAIVIYTASPTYLPTIYPAQYYGCPDNNVYVIAKMPSGRTQIKFVISRLKEFSYNYKEKKLIDHKYLKSKQFDKEEIETALFNLDALNEPFQKMKEITTLLHFTTINSFLAAEQALNKFVEEELKKQPIKRIRTKPPVNKTKEEKTDKTKRIRTKPPKGKL